MKCLLIFMLAFAMLFSAGCLSVVPDVPVLAVEEEEPAIVNEEIHKIEIEMDATLPILVGESIVLRVHAYNWPEVEGVQLDTGDTIVWSENCDEDVLVPLEGLSTTFTAEKIGKYQVSACYEYPKVEGCPSPQYLCAGTTIYVVEE